MTLFNSFLGALYLALPCSQWSGAARDAYRYGLDEGMAFSRHEFGGDAKAILQVLPKRFQLEWYLLASDHRSGPDKNAARPSQAHSHEFSNVRQIYNLIAPFLRPIHISAQFAVYECYQIDVTVAQHRGGGYWF